MSLYNSDASDGTTSDTAPGVDFSVCLDVVIPSETTLPAAKRICRKPSHKDDVDEALLQHLKNLDEKRSQPQSMTDEEQFGRHVAMILQRLPGRAQALG